MPYSNGECRSWVCDQIVFLNPTTILDIGVGHGTYARALKSALTSCKFTGIEIFEPYVARFDLTEWYAEIIIGDAREVEFPSADVIVCGDVLEHMRYAEARAVWEKARASARQAVFVSLPIIDYPQGAWEGNAHEAHLHTWSHELACAQPGVLSWQTGHEIGAYRLSPLSEP